MKTILLIEDERNLSRLIELELRHESFEVMVAHDGKRGLELALQQDWGVILLDLMLPGMDGIEVCCRIREVKRTPIIMLTARDSLKDRISGLDSGADDYIAKPFAIEELLARIRVVFRRQENISEAAMQLLTFQDIVMNLDSRNVTKGGKTIDLTKREYDLLQAFMRNTNRVLDRETLLDMVWGFEAGVETNVVDVYVRYLRNKMDNPAEDSCIQTVRGIGYVMRR
ncbi:response regulator transcription factor [Paenibacillus radicis (ex Xue et al. 2023)]|uniref:Response regulator transcription factor n=1 Tax=Paenibacillus radicis (ex Xue et al. 2023) TaxID=2972489 RepID=A0ABT1YGD9_9BACL|nr:response regulator transcription factor [Paenibacillus radicis (ex Xue et al. 2023)]MCR8632267.1 response regulator transcription factor [Paenibacillus radicis (ex Xue et al. 2023)]